MDSLLYVIFNHPILNKLFSLFQAYVNYIRSLPICTDPCVFGLHSNADITKDNQETNQLLDGILLTLPRQTGGGAKSPQVCFACVVCSILTYANFPEETLYANLLSRFVLSSVCDVGSSRRACRRHPV